MQVTLGRRVVTEGVGTALLLAVIVGSGTMGERLSDGSVGLALLANSFATGAGLVALILAFGPLSGAHLNPAVTLSAACLGEMTPREALAYAAAQIVGAAAGVALANGMFEGPLVALSAKERSGHGQFLGEFVATFGLVLVIHACVRSRPAAVAYAVGAYIAAAHWFTSSTSFANPAVTLARTMTDTFTGIRVADAPAFVAAQVLGTGAAVAFVHRAVPRP